MQYMLALIKKFFDEEYFIERMNELEGFGDQTLLYDYIYKLNKSQLKEFLVCLIREKHERGWFLSSCSSSHKIA